MDKGLCHELCDRRIAALYIYLDNPNGTRIWTLFDVNISSLSTSCPDDATSMRYGRCMCILDALYVSKVGTQLSISSLFFFSISQQHRMLYFSLSVLHWHETAEIS